MNKKILLVFIIGGIVWGGSAFLIDDEMSNPCIDYYDKFLIIFYEMESGFDMEKVDDLKRLWYKIEESRCVETVELWMPVDREKDMFLFKELAKSGAFEP